MWLWKCSLAIFVPIILGLEDRILPEFPRMTCQMVSCPFVLPFWDGHLKKLLSGFLGAIKPSGWGEGWDLFMPFSEKESYVSEVLGVLLVAWPWPLCHTGAPLQLWTMVTSWGVVRVFERSVDRQYSVGIRISANWNNLPSPPYTFLPCMDSKQL